jgi:colanic acid biosynthesis glycosyl transferase WcaI
MRVVLHDYGNYPFPTELARELSRRGHCVLHLSSGSYATPGAAGIQTEQRSTNYSTGQVVLDSPIEKSSLLKRRFQEREYGRRLTARVAEFEPDVVLSANTPLEAHAPLLQFCRKNGIRFVNWVQDAYGTATDRLVRKRLGRAGALVGRHYLRMERKQLRESDFIVVISDDFLQIADEAGVSRELVKSVPNWAPLGASEVAPKDNPVSRELGISSSFNFVYAGTLGMKHNPVLLLELAASFRDDEDVRVVVVSAGAGADWLREAAHREQLPRLVVLRFQPYERVAGLLAGGDVLVAILEPEASEFSVPSKVLTYLCAGRAVLLAMPFDNLAAETVVEAGAGLVVHPDDSAGFIEAARSLYEDHAQRTQMSTRARAYAELTFRIEPIADAFEGILSRE